MRAAGAEWSPCQCMQLSHVRWVDGFCSWERLEGLVRAAGAEWSPCQCVRLSHVRWVDGLCSWEMLPLMAVALAGCQCFEEDGSLNARATMKVGLSPVSALWHAKPMQCCIAADMCQAEPLWWCAFDVLGVGAMWHLHNNAVLHCD